MSKLINGRPMSELVLDGRTVVAISKSGICGTVNAVTDLHCDWIEWAEVVKPETKPDTNGWFKLSADCQPEVNLKVVFAYKNLRKEWEFSKIFSLDKYDIGSIWTHFKYIDFGKPVE